MPFFWIILPPGHSKLAAVVTEFLSTFENYFKFCPFSQDIVKQDAVVTTEDLTAAQTKVEEAQAAVQTASSSATTTEAKAELVKIESSLLAARQIVNDAISKAETVAPGITQEAIGKAQTVIPGITQA